MHIKLLTFLSAILISPFSFASDVHSQLETSANIEHSCNIVMDDINLGVLDTNVIASTTGNYTTYEFQIKSLCTNGTAYEIGGDKAPSIESPVTPGTYYAYIFPLRHATEPVENEYLGFRFRRIPTGQNLGDGTKAESGSATYTISGTGTGTFQQTPIFMQLYVYKHVKAGNYAATHHFFIKF